ncbi:Inositol 2-dehydrogenase/D-chiro-inositol 3-dehydrogenase [subsurface metagenome]
MKQIVQNFKNGQLSLKEVPAPNTATGGVLVKTVNSLISIGTEKMMLDLGRKSMLGKAKERPDQVQQVIKKVKKEGLKSTYQKVMNQLEEPKPLGYSCSGIVLEVGENGGNFQVGDRVACAGAGYANHAEINYIPKNLTVKIPDSVSFEEAAYTTLSAIALQGVRQAEPNLGDVVFVMGLGLLGLITVQLLKANGCIVIGSDLDSSKIKVAQNLGIDYAFMGDQFDMLSQVNTITQNQGVDVVIITASSKSNEPIELAAELARHKSKVIAVGMIPMNIPRNAYYLKELDLRLSMSYGPGRYDPFYEERGQDYPYAYVRWTEQRNMQAVLNLIAQGKLDVNSLTTQRFKFEKAEEVYDNILQGKENYLGVLFEYDKRRKNGKLVKIKSDVVKNKKAEIVLGLIGAGNYAGGMLFPHIKKHPGVEIYGIATGTGISAEDTGKRYKAQLVTTDYRELLKTKKINTVFITTRHNLHAEQIVSSLKSGKHVFVEKPIALSLKELVSIKNSYRENQNILFVGYNRRYSSLANKLKEFFNDKNGAMSIIYRVNAGFIPKDHWTQDPGVGGGRIIGEVCHFIDFMIFLSNSLPGEVYTSGLSVKNEDQVVEDNISAVFRFKNGSIGTIIYTANGDSAMEKEYIEVFSNDKSAKLIDFKELYLYEGSKKKRIKLANQDKGQEEEIKYFFDLIKGDSEKRFSFDEVYYGSLATFKILESLRTGKPIKIEG